ncbi:unnamed protein product, partial [Tilletia controversa]
MLSGGADFDPKGKTDAELRASPRPSPPNSNATSDPTRTFPLVT